MPHLVDDQDFDVGWNSGLGQSLGLGTDPAQDGYVAHAQDASDHPEAHVAHRVEQHSHRLHRRRLTLGWCIREVAAAGSTAIALQTAHETALGRLRPAAGFAR